MKRLYLGIAALLGVMVLLGFILWSTPRPTTLAEPETVRPGDIVGIAVTAGDGPAVTAVRTAPGVWAIRDGDAPPRPGATAALRDAQRAAAELLGLERLAPRELTSPVRVELTVAGSDEPRTLELATTSIGGARAVTIDGSSTVMAPHALCAALLHTDLWLDHSAFPGLGPGVNRLLIEQQGAAVELTKTAGRWLLVAPVLARADTDAVNTAIGRLASTRIERFEKDLKDPVLTGLREPVFTVTVESDRGRQRLAFGASADVNGVYRFASPDGGATVFVVDTTLLRDLRLDPAPYTDRRVTAVPALDIAALSITTPNGDQARAVRTLRGWDITGDPWEGDPQEVVDQFTTDAGSTVTFEEPAGWEPLATLTLENTAGEPLDIIWIGRGGDRVLRAKTQLPGGAPVYYTLPGFADVTRE